MSNLPEAGYLRIKQIIGDPKRGIPALVPVAASTWWRGVQNGIYPPAVRLGPRMTAWHAKDIRLLLEDFSAPTDMSQKWSSRHPSI